MLNALRNQKHDLIGWYKVTKDKAIRKEIRKIDKLIKEELSKNE